MAWDRKKRFDTITLKNLVTEQELILSDEANSNSGYLLENIDWGTAQGNFSTVVNVGQIGFDKLHTYLSPRPVAITGWVALPTGGHTEESDHEYIRKLRQTGLNKLVNPFHDLRLEYKDYYLICTPTESIQYGNDYRTENNEIMTKFLISATAYIPLFRKLEVEDVTQISIEKVKLFPGEIPINGTGGQGLGMVFGKILSDGSLTVENDGDVPVGFEMGITATANIVNPTVFVESDSGVKTMLKFVGTLLAGNSLVLGTEYGAEFARIVNNGDVVNENALLLMSEDSVLPIFEVGTSKVEVWENENVAKIATNYTLRFTPMFLEVW